MKILSVAEAQEAFDEAQANLQVAILVEQVGLVKARALVGAIALERGLLDEGDPQVPE